MKHTVLRWNLRLASEGDVKPRTRAACVCIHVCIPRHARMRRCERVWHTHMRARVCRSEHGVHSATWSSIHRWKEARQAV